MKIRRWMAVMCVSSIMIMQGIDGNPTIMAVEKCEVTTQEELRTALGESKEILIRLQANIMVDRCLVAKGKKIIDGGGTYAIKRKVGSGKAYLGTLLRAKGTLLTLQAVTLDGGGRSSKAPKGINGKLLEVNQGTVILQDKTVLKENYNLASRNSGGGGLLLCGGKAIMKEGSWIVDNLTMQSGAGVRVEKGSVLVLEGGKIQDNAVVGQSSRKGFDGRGGGIYNEGTVIMQGGSLKGNLARGYCLGKRSYGGFGDDVYNAGALRLDGTVSLQSIYLERNRYVEVTKSWKNGGGCEIEPEEYRDGRILVRGGLGRQVGVRDGFVLKKRAGFALWRKKNTLQIKKKAKKKEVITPTHSPRVSLKPDRESQEPMETKVPKKRENFGKKKEKLPVVTTEPARKKTFVLPQSTVVPETPGIETVPVTRGIGITGPDEKVGGCVIFVRNAGGESLSEYSIWRQPEYLRLLQQTFQKEASQYDQVWRISAEDMKEIRRFSDQCEEKESMKRCQKFLEIFTGRRE